MEKFTDTGGMIVSCPACGARVKLDRVRHGGKRLKLRCARCGEVHQVEIPAAAVSSSTSALKVLIAHSDTALCAAVGEILAPYNAIDCHACHNGDDALLTMERLVPDVALVDVALPGLFAFELVGKVRQRRGLEGVKLVLLSSVYNKMAYKRTPNSLYGADDYIEKHHLPSDLVPKIQQLTGRRITSSESALPSVSKRPDESSTALLNESASREKVESLNTAIRHAESSEVVGSNDAYEALEKARRLARIIVSDIALYNQERVEEGIRDDSFYTLLATEIEEGRKLFNERVARDVPGRESILQDTFENFIARRRDELRR